MRPRLSLALSMLAVVLIAAVSASPPAVPNQPTQRRNVSLIATSQSLRLTTPKLAITPYSFYPVTPAPTWTPRPTPTSRITTTCKPAPGPTTDAQRYLLLYLGPEDYCWGWWIIEHESSWRVDEWDDPSEDGPCGLPQAKGCSKMSECYGQPKGCPAVPDWRTNAEGQIRWMDWWICVAMAPDPQHPRVSEGGTRYGSWIEAACHEFGCRTPDGLWGGVLWY